MAEKTYYQKLQDPRWQKLRLEAMQKSKFCCELCYDEKSTLNVHHKDYIKGREPWEYGVTQLTVLCESCHHSYHDKIDPIRFLSTILSLSGGEYGREKIAFMLAGFLKIDYDEFLKKIKHEGDNYVLVMYKLGVRMQKLEDKLLKEIFDEMV
jgi:hypothetical protein